MPGNNLWQYILQPADEGKKYEDILARKFHFSRKLLQYLKQGEKVWINGRFSYLSARGHAGETLTIELCSPEHFNIPTAMPSGAAFPSLDILFEDDYLLAVNKPAGQVVHPNPRYPTGTLGNDITGYWERNGEVHPFRPIHRIDRNTSGVVLVAKNRFTHQQLARQLEIGTVHKRYLGFVSGRLDIEEGLVDKPIGLAPGSFIKREVRLDGQTAQTRFRVLARYPRAALLEFILLTGRTHQIRAHCEALGHPMLGDDLYGGETDLISRQALHSLMYSFDHPVSGNRMLIKAPFPTDLRSLVRKLKG